ncbi:MAG: ATP-binding protein [Coriobacteriales bacterium]|nr:ATP-binding protein [Coriobacteriales bacterium]
MFGTGFELNDSTLRVVESLGSMMPGGFFIYKATGNEELIFANHVVFSIFGCEDRHEFEELTGNTFGGMLFPEDYEAITHSINDQIASSEDDMDAVEYRIVRKDGQIRWVEDYGHFVQTEAYGGLYYVFITDITEKRMRMESDNRVRLAVIEALSKAYHTLWLINDVETERYSLYRGDISDTNPYAVPVEGVFNSLRYSDSKDHYIDSLVAPQDRARMHEELELSNIVRRLKEEPQYFIQYLRILDGEERYFRVELAKVDMPDGKMGVVCGFKDVDDEVRREMSTRQALRDAVSAANVSNRAKSDFLASMSHDLRTPLNGIVGMTALAQANLEHVDRLEDCLAKIADSSEHLLRLVNEILDMNKIELGKMDFVVDEMSITELVDGLCAITKDEVDVRGHSLDMRVDVTNDKVVGDHTRLQEVLLNLLENAIEFTPDGGSIRLEAHETGTTTSGVGTYEFVVQDSGIGMTEEFLERLYEPFSRAEEGASATVQGAGLGLTIANNIVHMMGGTIHVQSTLGKGSTFTVTVPLEVATPKKELGSDDALATQDHDEPLKGIDELDFGGHRILLVEDNELNAEIATSILEMANLSVDRAKDGMEAVRMFEAAEPGYYALVLMDIRMPRMNGHEATRRIRRLGVPGAQTVPIVALSANAFEEDKQNSRRAGMNGHIAKPVDFDELAAVLQEWIPEG